MRSLFNERTATTLLNMGPVESLQSDNVPSHSVCGEYTYIDIYSKRRILHWTHARARIYLER